MIIGTTKEMKNNEFRVGLTPDNVAALVAHGHTVLVETRAGEGASFTDAEYLEAGASILATPQEVFAAADMIVKVKEPEEFEYDMLREGQILYTYLHLAPNPGLTKFLLERADAFKNALGLKPGSFVVMAAGKKSAAQKTAGVVRTMLGRRIPGHFDEKQYAFCWIVDFPMYEMGEESGQLEFCHNPFSMPQGGMQALLDAEGDVEKLLAINADQYDLVVNGYESASGAVRNHDPEIMVKAFQMVGLGEEDVKAKFPAMYNAFTYGAPPHAGAAPGVDRLIMLLTGEESIREVITFPMNKTAQDLMMGAPTAVDQSQLDTVHIALVEE